MTTHARIHFVLLTCLLLVAGLLAAIGTAYCESAPDTTPRVATTNDANTVWGSSVTLMAGRNVYCKPTKSPPQWVDYDNNVQQNPPPTLRLGWDFDYRDSTFTMDAGYFSPLLMLVVDTYYTSAGTYIVKDICDDTPGTLIDDTPTVSSSSCTVTVLNVDTAMAGVSEANEDDPGGYLRLNDDDDNNNGTPDKGETGTVTGEDDLVQITLTGVNSSYWNGNATLDKIGTQQRVRVWTSPTKGTEVTLPHTYSNSQLPVTLWVEGTATSNSLMDSGLTFNAYVSETSRTVVDQVKMTVCDIHLKEVSFFGTNCYTVAKDDGSGYYVTDPNAPTQWQDNSSPLDSDANDVDDHKYPLCYTRDTKMRVSVKMIVAPVSAFGQTLKIKGTGPDGMSFPETVATLNGTEVTITNIECAAPFPNEVKWYGAMTISWQLSRDNGTLWLSPLNSDNEVDVTLGTPECATRFRTVLYLACKNGGTNANLCTSGTWDSFSGGNVYSWDDTAKNYTRPLCYYSNHSGDNAYTVADLLSHGNGQCLAWARLLNECLRVNNVTDASRTWVHPPSGLSGFGVGIITFDDTDPMWPLESTWKYGVDPSAVDSAGRELDDLDITTLGLAGQNTDTPYAKLFDRHYIVHRGGMYYDPSYSIMTADSKEYSIGVLDAWEYSDYCWCKAANQSGIYLMLEDLMTW